MKRRLLALETSALILLTFHPILLFANGAALSMRVPLALFAELLSLLLGVAQLWLPVKRRVLLAASVLLLSCLTLIFLPFTWAQRALLFPGALMTFLIACGALRRRFEGAGLAMMAIAGIFYVISAILLRADVYPAALRGALFLGAALLIPTGFGAVNRDAVGNTLASHAGVTATTRLTVMNRVLSWLFSGVVIFVACFERIQKAVRAALDFILDVAGKVAAFLMSLLPTPQTVSDASGGGMGDMIAGLAENAEPSPFWTFMEEVVKYLAILLAAAAFGFALYKLWQKCSAALKKWLKALQEKLLSTSEDYEDETVSLRPEETKQDARARRGRKKPLPARWEDMGAKDRIRYVCGVLMAKKSPRPADTARGLMEDQALSGAYETARYSNLPLSEEQAQMADAVYRQIRR